MDRKKKGKTRPDRQDQTGLERREGRIEFFRDVLLHSLFSSGQPNRGVPNDAGSSSRLS